MHACVHDTLNASGIYPITPTVGTFKEIMAIPLLKEVVQFTLPLWKPAGTMGELDWVWVENALDVITCSQFVSSVDTSFTLA